MLTLKDFTIHMFGHVENGPAKYTLVFQNDDMSTEMVGTDDMDYPIEKPDGYLRRIVIVPPDGDIKDASIIQWDPILGKYVVIVEGKNS